MQHQPTDPTAGQVIRAAIYAAGGVSEVAKKFGLSSPAVTGWLQRSAVPADKIKPLCDMGCHVVKADQILEAMARESAARKAA